MSMKTFVSLGKDLGTFTARESKILEAIFRFRKVQAITIMIPRTELCSVDIGLNSEQIMKVISQYRYRYLTIINKSFDNFIGVLDIKRFAMGYLLMKKHWSQTCVQKAVYVPELATLNYVLAQLRNEKQKVAMVVDEYGGISGLISIDDIIEEIIGELSDEFKNPSWDIIQKTPRHWQLSGLVPLQELRNSLAIILPSGLSAETVGGLIINKLGHLPKTGESIIIDHYRFEVRHCRRHSIVAVDLYDIEKTES